MGPRARARGNQAGRLCLPRPAARLQWGHERALVEMRPISRAPKRPWSFNGATSARSWKWGKAAAPRQHRRASMGPRARARGNEATPGLDYMGAWASMGPRARARGNPAAGDGQTVRASRFNGATSARSWKSTMAGLVNAAPDPLQWGHERALVEISVCLPNSTAPDPLQWGHERALVEMRMCGLSTPARWSCFNGATSARSWK